ncbi:hypothetical protein M231_06728 [Tremella mesenterica]|uniref:Uncharacterized protein n=1 Tax=Tremella mesenterica TaxID=5217 RepID=A0A4Q1BDM3_TREME|nr:hypothetical protein M231_06728 [Tremella mesenterica]
MPQQPLQLPFPSPTLADLEETMWPRDREDNSDHSPFFLPGIGYGFRHPSESLIRYWPQNALMYGFEEFYPQPQQPLHPKNHCLQLPYLNNGKDKVKPEEVVYPAFMYKHAHMPRCRRTQTIFVTWQIEPTTKEAILGPCWGCLRRPASRPCLVEGARIRPYKFGVPHRPVMRVYHADGRPHQYGPQNSPDIQNATREEFERASTSHSPSAALGRPKTPLGPNRIQLGRSRPNWRPRSSNTSGTSENGNTDERSQIGTQEESEIEFNQAMQESLTRAAK